MYRFTVRARLTVRANFYVHFADSIFDIWISVDDAEYKSHLGKNSQSLPVSLLSLGQLNTDFQ